MKKRLLTSSCSGGGITRLRNNAFTLIELLAIIVILAIIAVITVPIILNIIENSRKGAATDSAYGYKDSVNKYYISELQNHNKLKLDGKYTVNSNGSLTPAEDNTFGFGDENVTSFLVQVSGTIPSSGELTYDNNVLTEGWLVIGDYRVTFNQGGTVTTTKNNGSSSNEQGNSGNQQIVIPTITSCTGCVFTKDGGELFKDQIVDSEATLVNDYSDLGDNFYGLVINNNNNYITNIFVCGIYNNNPFCLEGGDPNKYSHNVEILNDIYGSCGDSNSSDSSCGAAYADDSGYVGMSGTNGDGYICVTEEGYGYYGSGC